MRPVAITGVGVVMPGLIGGAPALEAYLAAPRPGAPDAAVDDRALTALMDEGEGRRLSRICRLAVAAGRLALTDAGRGADAATGLVVGTEFGDLRSTIAFADAYLAGGPAALSALLFPNTVMNAMAAATTIAVGARALSLTLTAPAVAGELAVARAALAVAGGGLDAVLAGGVDEREPLLERMRAELGARDPRGEGAVFLVLESLAGARARGGRVLGEIHAAAWRSLPARPHGTGRPTGPGAVEAALTAAGLRPARLGWAYVSASGDVARDRWEAAVLDHALGEGRIPRGRLAALAGASAATGGLAVAAASWTARSGRLPSTAGAVQVARGPGLVHGLARGGTQVALVVAPPGAAASRRAG